MAIEGTGVTAVPDATLVQAFGQPKPYAWLYVVRFTVADEHAVAMGRHYATHPARFVEFEDVGEARVHRYRDQGGPWHYRVSYQIANGAVPHSVAWQRARATSEAVAARQWMEGLTTIVVPQNEDAGYIWT